MINHPTHNLEVELNATAGDILEAVSKGFRAKVDVKGKLAELFLFRQIELLKIKSVVSDVEWHDKDGKPDFEVMVDGRVVIIECKNVRSDANLMSDDHATVEIQKTRNGTSSTGIKTRGYSADHFDILAACLFNATGDWDFRFALTADLARRPGQADMLKVMQRVELRNSTTWHNTVESVLNDFKSRHRPSGP